MSGTPRASSSPRHCTLSHLPGKRLPWTSGSFKSTNKVVKSHGFRSRHPCSPVPLDNHVQAGCSVHRQLGSQRDQLSRERWPVGAESQQPRSCSTRHDKIPLAPCTLNLRSQHVPQLLSDPSTFPRVSLPREGAPRGPGLARLRCA